MDAMQTKGFQPLDPTEQPKGWGRSRSRSVGSKRGKQKEEEELLCPLEEFPASGTQSIHCATIDLGVGLEQQMLTLGPGGGAAAGFRVGMKL